MVALIGIRNEIDALFAAEDKARKDEVDTHNNAEHLVYQTEKTLNELEGKISADEKASIQAAADKLKELNKGNDTFSRISSQPRDRTQVSRIAG